MKKIFTTLPLLTLTLTACSLTNSSSNSSSSDASSLDALSSSTHEESLPVIPEFLEDYSLFWHDEFDGDTLSDNWEPQIGDGSNYSVYRWGNNEEQYYKKENATVSGGRLHITAKKEKTTYYTEKEEERTYEYTSARLRTKGKVTTTYGYVEARIRLPEGTGMWPAFWMLPESNFEGMWWPTSGEIDIMEAKGRLLDKFGSTIHTGNANNQDYYKFKEYTFSEEEDDITAFHNYGVLWSKEGFTFYVDEKPFFSLTPKDYQNRNELYAESESAPFDRPFHILLNLAVGGNYDGGRSPDENFKQAEMLVDYVRIYQKNK